MNQALIAAVALAALAALATAPASAATAASAPAHSAKKPAAKAVAAEPETAPDDDLNPVQLTLADRVLTGMADCELKQHVSIEKVEGHSGNFKVTFDKHVYIVQPRETTTGAIVLVDKAGNVEWLQIPKKSMLMNVKLHQRLVDNCQEDEQRIASQSAAEAAANAPMLAPSVATPASVAAAERAVATAPAAAPAAVPPAPAPAPVKASAKAGVATVKVTPPEPVQRSAQAPDAAASGMWR